MYENVVGVNMKILNTLIEKQMNQDINQIIVGLTNTQMLTLSYLLANEDRPVLQKEIESHFKLSHPTTRGIIKRLSERGLVIVTSLEDDRRQMTIRLTNNGSKLTKENYELIHQKCDELEKRIFNGVSTEQQKLFKDIMKKLIHNMD